MRHSYRCHASPDDFDRDHERNGERHRLDPMDLFDTARCPCCRAPLVARMGREGPYFHCCCSEKMNLTGETGEESMPVSSSQGDGER